MLSLSHQSKSPLGKRRSARQRAAFSLMEVVMALAVLGTLGAGCFLGFNSLNAFAVSSRLYTEAQTAAQNQIDLILSKEPFDPGSNKVPAVLTLGTTVTPNVFIYTDPVSNTVLVRGTMTTTVTDMGTTMSFVGTNNNLHLYRATVAVTYTFRNRNYNVTMDTIRTADL
jgi:prepilin-type N-terminal cleavage/methylation domain-containing protein